MRLNELRDNQGARKSMMRVGRGIGCGKGKTCGRGHKGQKSRPGVSVALGEQMAWYLRLSRRGFINIFRKSFDVVNLGDLQKAVDAKKIDASKKVTLEVLQKAGLVGKVKAGVRLLAKGQLSTPLNLEVTGTSQSAQAALEKVGGSLTLVPYKPSKKDPKKSTMLRGKKRAASSTESASSQSPAKKKTARKADAKK